MLKHSNQTVLEENFSDICECIDTLKNSKSINIKASCLEIFPYLASYCPEKFLGENSKKKNYLILSIQYVLGMVNGHHRLRIPAFRNLYKIFEPYNPEKVNFFFIIFR